MSKASRTRQQSARARIAEQRAAARRQQVRNRILLTGGIIVLVVVVVVVFVVLSAGKKTPKASAPTGTVLPTSVARQVTSVPASALATGGSGSVLVAQTRTRLKAISGTPLTSNGKPEMLYIGAESACTRRAALVDGGRAELLRAASRPRRCAESTSSAPMSS